MTTAIFCVAHCYGVFSNSIWSMASTAMSAYLYLGYPEKTNLFPQCLDVAKLCLCGGGLLKPMEED